MPARKTTGHKLAYTNIAERESTMTLLGDALNFYKRLTRRRPRHRPKSIALDQKIGHPFGPHDGDKPHVVPWGH